MGPSMIQVRNVSLRLGEFAVYDASLEVAEGEYFVLLGPTGAGKTVLLECIAGLHRPESGEILVDGNSVRNMPPEQRGLGYLPQDYALFPHLNVAQNMAFGLRLRRRPRPEIDKRVGELAELLGITHLLKRSTLTLSGGEQQRVALARAVTIEPKVLLLDEPLSALDEQTRESLCVELRRVHDELGTTTLHVSHNFEETLAVADRIGIISEGRMRQVGTVEDVFRRPDSEFVARFVRADNLLRGRALRKNGGLEVRVGELAMQAGDGPEGEVFLVVRPEDVGVVRETEKGRPNLVTGRIAEIVNRGALMRVDIDVQAGLMVKALMTRRAFLTQGLAKGEVVSAFFDPSSTYVFSAN